VPNSRNLPEAYSEPVIRTPRLGPAEDCIYILLESDASYLDHALEYWNA
jgi:hypothetical protein